MNWKKTMKSKMSIQTRNKETVLAIDPGFDRVGVAVLQGEKLLFSDCIITDRKKLYEERLFEIGEAVRKIIKKWKPKSLAMEKLFFNQNITTALKVAEARGVIAYEAASAGLTVYEYSPQAIKIATTGYGKAGKPQVESMVRRLIKIPPSVKRLDDEMDAIALGITHLASRRDI